MFTAIVLIAIAVLWWKANQAFMTTGLPKFRRRRSSWGWAFIGASVGSFFGVAGFGGAIIGTVPGAVIGYLFASNLMKREFDDNTATPSTTAKPAVITSVPVTASQESVGSPRTSPSPGKPDDTWGNVAGTLIVVALVGGW